MKKRIHPLESHMGFSLTVDDKSGIFVNIGIIFFFFSLLDS